MSGKAGEKRGRPGEYDKPKIVSYIVSQRDRVMDATGKITGKKSKVWSELEEDLKKIVEKVPKSLYTFVSCNRGDVKEKLFEALGVERPRKKLDDSDEPRIQDGSTWQESVCERPESSNFIIEMTADDFESLLVIKEHRTTTHKNKKAKREVVRMQEDEWGDALHARIWAEQRLSCAFNFQGHYITADGSKGRANGKCKCGGTFFCAIERNDSGIVKFNCQITKGKGKCGKRQLKGRNRERLAKELKMKTVYALRSEIANELIVNDSDEEPPLLYTSAVLRTLKWQEETKNHMHPDPLISLLLICLQKMPHEIHYYCVKPFFIIWSTKHQMTVYKQLFEKEHVCLQADASGRFVRQLELPDKSRTGPIYLYSAIAKTPTKHVAVAQMLSERHTTSAISFWLAEAMGQAGLPIPKEVVCDGSKALIAASIRAFTNRRTIIQYADAFFDIPLRDCPSCYIRLDVAHFLKKYRDLFQKAGYAIKQFYLASLGKLIRCVDRNEAEKIIQALLTISQCETDGEQVTGDKSAVQKEKEFMEALLTDEDYVFEEHEDSYLIERDGVPNEEEEEDYLKKKKIEPSKWYDWICRENQKVLTRIRNAPGKPRSANAFHFPKFAEQLVEDSTFLPLWSCITLNYFGYGRNPASSSQVEIEFKNIRHLLLPSYGLHPPIRADRFVEVYSKHVSGLSKITRTANPSVDPIDHLDANGNGGDVPSIGDKLPHSSPAEDNGDETTKKCLSCGNVADGAHKCSICKGIVHAITLCSVAHGEEGFGQTRICNRCKISSTFDSTAQHQSHQFNGTLTNNWTEEDPGGCADFFHNRAPFDEDLFNHLRSNLGVETDDGVTIEDIDNNNLAADTNESGLNPKAYQPQHTSTPSNTEKSQNKRQLVNSTNNNHKLDATILDLRTTRHNSSTGTDSNLNDRNNVPIVTKNHVCITCGNEAEPFPKCRYCYCPVHSTNACSLAYQDGSNFEHQRICFVCNNLIVFTQGQYQDDSILFQSNHPSNLNKPTEEAGLPTNCPVCKRVVGVAHMCKICNLAVHAIETCSIPDPNTPEGWGQSRICLNCHVNELPKTIDLSLADIIEKCSTCGLPGKNWCICISCRCLIHSTDLCSVPCNEDDRGVPQGRLCKSCTHRSDVGELITTHCMENWKGQAMKYHQKEIRGYFLQKKYPKDILTESKKLAKIPILRTGADPELKSVSLNNRKLNLINTCTFDSLFQLFLSVLYDSNEFRERAENLRVGNSFFKMLLNVRENGVNRGAYVSRAQILWPISEIGRENAGCITIDARMTAGGLCRNLLREAPCFREISKCDICNYQCNKEFVLTSISIESLKHQNYNKEIEREIILSQNRCCSDYTQRNDRCMGKITSQLLILESYLIFEIRLNSENETLDLIDIPPSLKLSMMSEEYPLRGIAAFQAPDIEEKITGDEVIGHYKGFCFRNRRWTEYDHKMRKCNDNCLVSPHLVLYAK